MGKSIVLRFRLQVNVILLRDLIASPFRAWMKNRNKNLGFSPNNSLAKA
jgi:hypothetical protein